MLSRCLLALLAAGSIALPALADDDDDDDGPRTTVCHRTSGRAVQGFFPGHVIKVSASAISKHVPQHGDVIVSREAERALGVRGGGDDDDDDRRRVVCLIDASGNLFNARRQLVQYGAGEGGGSDGPG